jgi:hypothetical protein
MMRAGQATSNDICRCPRFGTGAGVRTAVSTAPAVDEEQASRGLRTPLAQIAQSDSAETDVPGCCWQAKGAVPYTGLALAVMVW